MNGWKDSLIVWRQIPSNYCLHGWFLYQEYLPFCVNVILAVEESISMSLDLFDPKNAKEYADLHSDALHMIYCYKSGYRSNCGCFIFQDNKYFNTE